jgi:hypothetical protein
MLPAEHRSIVHACSWATLGAAIHFRLLALTWRICAGSLPPLVEASEFPVHSWQERKKERAKTKPDN